MIVVTGSKLKGMFLGFLASQLTDDDESTIAEPSHL